MIRKIGGDAMSCEKHIEVDKKKETDRKISSKNLYFVLAFFAFLAIISGMFFLSIDNKENKIQEELEIAAQYMEEIRYEEALASYLEVIEMDAENIGAYIGAAKAYEELDNLENAINILQSGYKRIESRELLLKLNYYEEKNLEEEKKEEIRISSDEENFYSTIKIEFTSWMPVIFNRKINEWNYENALQYANEHYSDYDTYYDENHKWYIFQDYMGAVVDDTVSLWDKNKDFRVSSEKGLGPRAAEQLYGIKEKYTSSLFMESSAFDDTRLDNMNGIDVQFEIYEKSPKEILDNCADGLYMYCKNHMDEMPIKISDKYFYYMENELRVLLNGSEILIVEFKEDKCYAIQYINGNDFTQENFWLA